MALSDVLHKLWLTDDVMNPLQYISLKLDSQKVFRNRIAPLDLILIIEHHNTIRGRLKGLNKAFMLALCLLDVFTLAGNNALEFEEDLSPSTTKSRQLRDPRTFHKNI